ncbi:hypothetical protein GCM10020367_61060 [Streptomyces sannanensis]|uniref:Uncharacterized protein n=1 Tax=Streptomyces sannanensis TaxID=285536 RepID=A0ABP6SKB3_9ACTN
MSTIRVGKPNVAVDRAAHTRGVREGNHEGNYACQPGHRKDGSSTARRSTGINSRKRDPLLPEMPNLSPA